MQSQNKMVVRLCWGWIIFVCLATIIHGFYRTWWVAQGVSGNVQPNLLNPNQANDLEYIKHHYMTYIHLVTGIIIYLFGPLQFVPRIRRQWPRIHKWSGYIFFVTVIAAGITGIFMGFLFPVGKTSETSSSLLFSIIMIYCAIRAIVMILNKNVELHRQWMIRSYMIAIGPATMHAIIPLFIQLGGKDIGEALSLSLWIGFTLQLIMAEVWIHYTMPTTAVKNRTTTVQTYKKSSSGLQEKHQINL